MDQWMAAEQNSPGKHSDLIQFMSPFTCAILKRWFQLSLSAFGVYLLYTAVLYVSAVRDFGVARYETFKFEIFVQHHPSLIAQTSILSSLTGNEARYGLNITLRRKGCLVLSRTFSPITVGNFSYILVSSLQPIEMDGFSLHLFAHETQSPAVLAITSFELLGSADAGRSWRRAGSLAYRFVPMGLRLLSPEAGSTVDGNGRTVDYVPPWPLLQVTAVDGALFASACLLSAACGALRRTTQGRVLLTWACLLLALNAAAGGLGFLCLGMPRDALVPLTDGAIYLLMFTSLAVAERYFFDCLRVMSLLALLVRIVQDCSLYGDCGYLAQEPPLRAILVFATGFTFIFLRDRFLFGSMDAVVADRARADARWARLAAEPTTVAATHELEALANEVADACAHKPARHMNRLRPPLNNARASDAAALAENGDGGVGGSADPAACRGDGAGGNCGGENSEADAAAPSARLLAGAAAARAERLRGFDRCETVPGTADLASPVQSLDQLYAQARERSAILRKGE